MARRPLPSIRRTADLVFASERTAVFVDGCFWHGCPEHYVEPKTNAAYWRDKIAGNVRRDRETDALLREAGWAVVRIWEHQDPAVGADRVAEAVEARRRLGGGDTVRELP